MILMMGLKTQAVRLGASYRLPVHIIYRAVPGRLGGDLSFSDAIIAKYRSVDEQEMPSADFAFPKFGESSAGALLAELSQKMILLNRIRVQMNIRNYRIMQRYSVSVFARVDRLLNELRMQNNAYSGVSEETVRELTEIRGELETRLRETAFREASGGPAGSGAMSGGSLFSGNRPDGSGMPDVSAGELVYRTDAGAPAGDPAGERTRQTAGSPGPSDGIPGDDVESALVLRILAASARGNGTRERYVRQLITRMKNIGTGEEQEGREAGTASASAAATPEALLRKAETEFFYLMESGAGAPMTVWRSEAAKQFFWRIQRAPEAERSFLLETGGFSSLVAFEKVLRTMDDGAFRAFARPLVRRVSEALTEPDMTASRGYISGAYGGGGYGNGGYGGGGYDGGGYGDGEWLSLYRTVERVYAAGPGGAGGEDGLTGAVGLRGSAGHDGSSGLRGSEGTDGRRGADGSAGLRGSDGTDGRRGADGSSGLRGSDGTDGRRGAAGPAGAEGPGGQNGLNGSNGPGGLNGLNGFDGNGGSNGLDGLDGLSGLNGLDGLGGLNGLDGLSGPDGADGMVSALDRFFEEHTEEDWELFRSELVLADRNGELKELAPELYRALSGEARAAAETGGSGEAGASSGAESGGTAVPGPGREREVLHEKELLFRVLREERGTVRLLHTLIIEAIRNIAVIRENQKEFMTLAESIMDLTADQWHEFKRDVRVLHEEDVDIRRLIPETILREAVTETSFRTLEDRVRETEKESSSELVMQEGVRMSSEKLEFLRVLREETKRHDSVFTETGRKLYLNTVLRSSEAGRLVRPSFRELGTEARESWRSFVTELLLPEQRSEPGGPGAANLYFGKLAAQYGAEAGPGDENRTDVTETERRTETVMRLLEQRRQERILDTETITERLREAETEHRTEMQVFRLLPRGAEGAYAEAEDEIPLPASADMTVQRRTGGRDASAQVANAEAIIREAKKQAETESFHDIEFETVRYTSSGEETARDLKEVTDRLDRHERDIAGLLRSQKAAEERDISRELMKQIDDRLRMERLRNGR